MGLVLRTLSEVSVVMNAVSACDPNRTAVVDRGPLPCVGVAWGVRWLALANATGSPRQPLLLRGSNRFAQPPQNRPTKISGAMPRAKKTFAASLQTSCGRHAIRHPWMLGEIARHFPTLTDFGTRKPKKVWCRGDVAGPGIEPGTRGFSVLCSTN